MKISVTINPKFDFLKEYIGKIPSTFDTLPNIIYRDRNVVKVDEVSDLKLVIKSYHRIYLTNRIRYSYFYPSKAERAYTNAFRLIERGFSTPEPVAFIECFEHGLLKRSFFISLYTDFNPLSSVIGNDQGLLIRDLVRFTYRLHQHGIYHMDFSNGNILCKRENDGFQFSLIDNNRMKFGKFDYARRLKNFRQLGLTNIQLINVAEEYARLEHSNEIKTIEQIFHYVRKHRERNKLMKRAKRLAVTVGHRLAATLSAFQLVVEFSWI
jgi:hypothetical protein